MSGLRSFSGLLQTILTLVACFELGGSSPATATESVRSQHVRQLPRSATGHVAFHQTPPVADGAVDVFLDLAGPDSAAAWATISQVVWDYGFRTEFVFHVLPSPQNQVSFDAAKAVQVVRMHSEDGKSDECVSFIDAMLCHETLIKNDDTDDTDQFEFFDILLEEAVAGGSITEEQFIRSMQDPRIDQLVRIEIETAALLGVNAAPAVLLNSMYMMGLTGPEQMRDFQLFVGMGMTPQPQHEFYGETGWTSMKDTGSGSSIFAG